MATTLTATVGASGSNSYETVANADVYFANHPDFTTWDKLYTVDKERLLILATMLIDLKHIDGIKNDDTTTAGVPDQALKFPRAVDVDNGTEYIPAPVKTALYEQALAMAKGGTDSTITDLQAQGVSRVKLADLEYQFSGTNTDTELATRADIALRPFIKMAG